MASTATKQAPSAAEKAAVADFMSGLACSQAVLGAFADRYELEREQALRIAAGFEGGTGMQAGECGALVGVYLVLGLAYGGIDPKDMEAKQKTAEKVREATKRFRERHHNMTACRDLLDCDISHTDGLNNALKKRLFQRRCPRFVKDAVQITEEILAEP